MIIIYRYPLSVLDCKSTKNIENLFFRKIKLVPAGKRG
jgi:hypothetical protein